MRSWSHAVRRLLRRPGFSAATVVILGAGIAATAAVFSVVDAAVLQPLPYPNADRLVTVLEANTSKTDAAGLLAPPRLEDWNRLNRTFDGIAGSYAESVTETSGSAPERLASRRVSPRYFAVFGVTPRIGRTFRPEEDEAGGPAVAVISDRLWSRRFERSRDVLARRLTLGGRSYAVVGVMPADFDDSRVDLWLPAQLSPFLRQARDARFITGVGRMRPGVTIAAAQRDLARVQAQLGVRFPATDRDWSAQVTGLQAGRVGQIRAPLVFLLGCVGLLMAIALANVAGLVLAQLHRRADELTVRGFLGASRLRIVAGVVQEILILAGVATALAIAADAALLRVAAVTLTALPRTAGLHVDWRVLAVASLCGAAAAVVCGALPAWRATGPGTAGAAARTGRGIAPDGRSQRWLVGGQFAIATLLLASTGLMLRSYYNLSRVDPGFDAAPATTFHVGAAWDEDRAALGRLQQRLLLALANTPGVVAVGFANFLPASNATLRYQVQLQGASRDEHASERDQITVGERSVTSGYFAALGARIVSGSSCPDLAEVRRDAPKALVNRRFLTTHGGGRGLVGRYVQFAQGSTVPPMEIIGVVDDIREDNLRTAAVPYLYMCIGAGDWPDPEYVVRTAGDPRAVAPTIRSIVHAADPTRAVYGMMPLEQSVGVALDQTKLQTELVVAFGVAAAALAVVGLYGLVALGVATRRREIGIRIALGAEPRRVVRDLATRIGWTIGGGTAVGLGMTVVAQRELRSVVYGVAPLDPATLLVAIGCLALAAGVATLIPASRAARIDPAGAMRDS